MFINDSYTCQKKSSLIMYKYLPPLFLAFILVGCDATPDSVTETSNSSSLVSSSSSSVSDSLPPISSSSTQNSSDISSSDSQNSLSSSVSSTSSSSSLSSPITPTTRPLLILKVNYTNEVFTNSATTWSNKIYGTNTNQLNNYMSEVSKGSFSYEKVIESQEVSNDGIISITMSKNHPDSGAKSTIHSDLASVLILADEFIDYSQYDTNSDGAISYDEMIPMFIIAGNEDSYSGDNSENGVWAHQSCTSGSNAPILDGVRVMSCTRNGVYAIFGERHVDSSSSSHDATIGVIAHELGHAAFELPDLYDTFNEHAGIGYFGLMGAGMWGQVSFKDIPGNSPTHMCAWSKIQSEFMQAEVATSLTATQVSLTESSSNNFNVIKVPITSSEYFLLENRNNSGYDRGLFVLTDIGSFNGGLAIWHIDETVISQLMFSNTINNDKNHKGVDLEEASNAELDFDSQASGNAKNLYFQGNKTSFTPTTSPNTNSYTHTSSSIVIEDISAQSEVMSATITNPN